MAQKRTIRRIVGLCCLVGLVGIGHVAGAQEFSADMTKNNGRADKIYAGKTKVRWESNEQNSTMGRTAAILDDAQNTWVILMPDRRMYMDSPPGMMVKQLLTHLWRVQDADNACPEWKKVAEEAGSDKNWGSCTKIGSDTVNGRSAVKYEGVSKDGKKTHIWVDSKLRCVVKTDEGSGSFELRNIQEGPQPASLFEIPAGYTKFDMGAMMKQRQQ